MEKLNEVEQYDDEITEMRMFDRYPGYFKKRYNSYDTTVDFTRLFIAFPNNFVVDPCYQMVDVLTAASSFNYSLGQIIVDNGRYDQFLSKIYDFYEILGVTISACSSSTESPFSGSVTGVQRIAYPPLYISVVYDAGSPPLSLTHSQMLNNPTTFIVPADGNMHSKSIIIPKFMAGKFKTPLSSAGLNLWIYVGGYLYLNTIDPSYSEAFHIHVTMTCGFKGPNAVPII